MRRIRRVSVEVIRRELSLSVSQPAPRSPGTKPEDAKPDAPEDAAPPQACPLCASPWLLLASKESEEAAAMQREFEQHGIHTHRTSNGKLFTCAKSFEQNIGACDVSNLLR